MDYYEYIWIESEKTADETYDLINQVGKRHDEAESVETAIFSDLVS